MYVIGILLFTDGTGYEEIQCIVFNCTIYNTTTDASTLFSTTYDVTTEAGTNGDVTTDDGPDITTEYVTTVPPIPQWLPWENWSACTATCSVGTRTRVRSCDVSTGCDGSGSMAESCDVGPCTKGDNTTN